MLPVITIMPRRSGVPAAASFPASQASAFNGLTHHIAADTAADLAAVDRQPRRHPRQVERPPLR